MLTLILNVIGLILGVKWFGWWFLLPAMLCSTNIKVNNNIT
jgi:hypothetical protein